MRSALAAIFFIFSFLLGNLFGEVVEEKYFTMDELDLMASRKSWNELILALPRVIPAEKGKKWLVLVEKGALGYLTSLSDQKDTQVVEKSNELLLKFSSLQSSAAFRNKRREIILEGFESCFRSETPKNSCTQAAGAFASRENFDPELLAKLGVRVAKNDSAFAGLYLYARALNVSNRDILCVLPEIKAAILEGAASGDRKRRVLGREMLKRDCEKYLKSPSSSKAQ
jgi:hypothetical protein